MPAASGQVMSTAAASAAAPRRVAWRTRTLSGWTGDESADDRASILVRGPEGRLDLSLVWLDLAGLSIALLVFSVE